MSNFGEIAQTAAEIWRFFIFFKMAAVRQYVNFNILHVKLENAYSRPKIGVLGDFAPKMGSSMNERNVCNIGKMEEL